MKAVGETVLTKMSWKKTPTVKKTKTSPRLPMLRRRRRQLKKKKMISLLMSLLQLVKSVKSTIIHE